VLRIITSFIRSSARKLIVGLVAFLIPTVGQASEPSYSGFVVPEMAEILAAVRIDDPDLRREKLGEILVRVLTDTDNGIVYEVVCEYLWTLTPWFDFGPYEWIGEKEAEARGRYQIFALLDQQDLRSMDYLDRVSLLRTAIVDGRAAFGRRGVIVRPVAIEMVAREGVSELRELAEQYHSELAPVLRKSFPLEQFQLLLSLTSGAKGKDEALRLAAKRLLAGDACELRRRMREDKLYFTVVLDLTRRACRFSPIDGAQIPACQEYYELFAREWRRGPHGALTSFELSQTHGIPPANVAWLGYFTEQIVNGKTFYAMAFDKRQVELEEMVKVKGFGEAEAATVIDPPPCPCELEQAEPDPQREDGARHCPLYFPLNEVRLAYCDNCQRSNNRYLAQVVTVYSIYHSSVGPGAIIGGLTSRDELNLSFVTLDAVLTVPEPAFSLSVGNLLHEWIHHFMINVGWSEADHCQESNIHYFPPSDFRHSWGCLMVPFPDTHENYFIGADCLYFGNAMADGFSLRNKDRFNRPGVLQ
jgi:hypothetical protein